MLLFHRFSLNCVCLSKLVECLRNALHGVMLVQTKLTMSRTGERTHLTKPPTYLPPTRPTLRLIQLLPWHHLVFSVYTWNTDRDTTYYALRGVGRPGDETKRGNVGAFKVIEDKETHLLRGLVYFMWGANWFYRRVSSGKPHIWSRMWRVDTATKLCGWIISAVKLS